MLMSTENVLSFQLNIVLIENQNQFRILDHIVKKNRSDSGTMRFNFCVTIWPEQNQLMNVTDKVYKEWKNIYIDR